MKQKSISRRKRFCKFPSVIVCDICNNHITKGDGYALETEQLLMEPTYWHFFYNCIVRQQNPDLSLSITQFILPILQLAGRYKMWLVCEECAKNFMFNHSLSKKQAMRFWYTGKGVPCHPLFLAYRDKEQNITMKFEEKRLRRVMMTAVQSLMELSPKSANELRMVVTSLPLLHLINYVILGCNTFPSLKSYS